MRFLIVAPDYRDNSAGIRVLHRLCHELNELGYQARMYCRGTNDQWNTPIVRKTDQSDIVVYPEVVSGNPLCAKKVVRYVLNKPGYLGGETNYGDNEMILVYSPELEESAKEAANGREVHLFRFPVIEPELFFDDGRPKTKECYYIGKGESIYRKWCFSDMKGLIHITPSWPSNRYDLAELLKSTKTLYSFDDFTMLNTEAHFCGCDVYLVREYGGLELLSPGINREPSPREVTKQFVQKVNSYYAAAA